MLNFVLWEAPEPVPCTVLLYCFTKLFYYNNFIKDVSSINALDIPWGRRWSILKDTGGEELKQQEDLILQFIYHYINQLAFICASLYIIIYYLFSSTPKEELYVSYYFIEQVFGGMVVLVLQHLLERATSARCAFFAGFVVLKIFLISPLGECLRMFKFTSKCCSFQSFRNERASNELTFSHQYLLVRGLTESSVLSDENLSSHHLSDKTLLLPYI